MTQTLIAPSDTNYLNEFLEDLPDNCYFNKQLVGVGGTTVALTNATNYVVCVPFISLIINKLDTKTNYELFGFYGGITIQALKDYLELPGVKKILVTYDSLAKLLEYINPQDYKILIDEAHKLLDSASFRHRAVRTVMKNYEKFKSYVFMTATPVQDKYQLPELKELPKVTVDWGDIVPVNLTKIKANSTNELYDNVILTLVKHLNGELEGTPYLFMNSVTKILEIVQHLCLLKLVTFKDVKIICANNDNNLLNIQDKLGSNWGIERANSTPKRINFCTSTAFEGSDIYCEDGVTYIVSDGRKTHTKYDILTTIPQIVGRLRNSKYKNQVTLLYYDSPYFKYQTPDDYAEVVKKELNTSKNMIKDFEEFTRTRASDDKTLQAIKAFAKTDPYIYYEDDTMEVDTWAWYNELHNYEVVNTNYSVRLRGTELINNVPYKYTEGEIELTALVGVSKLKIGKKPKFRDVYEAYISLNNKALKTAPNLKEIAIIEYTYPWLRDAVTKLTPEDFSRLRYSQTKIKERLTTLTSTDLPTKVRELLNLTIGERYSNSELKSKVNKVTEILTPIQLPKKLIDQYYITKKTSFKLQGKLTRGSIIMGIK